MLPKHMIWDVGHRRLITGYESLRMIGFSPAALDLDLLDEAGITDGHLKELAGNAFAGQVVVALLLAVFAYWPCHSSEQLGERANHQIAPEPESDHDAEFLSTLSSII